MEEKRQLGIFPRSCGLSGRHTTQKFLSTIISILHIRSNSLAKKQSPSGWQEPGNRSLLLQPVHTNLGVRSLDSETLIFQVDESWVDSASVCRILWIVGSISHFSNLALKRFRQCLSPLHIEFEVLLWMM